MYKLLRVGTISAKIVAILFLVTCSGSVVSEKQPLFSDFTYTGISLDISAETSNARASYWNPDGTMIFVTGRDTENVVSYELSDPWNIETAIFSGEFDLSGEIGSTVQGSVIHGLYLHTLGDKMWVFNRTEIWGYTLSTPWNISSASQSYYKDLSEFVKRGHDFDFSPDGKKLFIDDRDARAVHEVSLSDPWNIHTIEWVFTLDISDQENEVRGLELVENGTVMYLMDTGRREVLRYELSEAYELKSAVFNSSFSVAEQTQDPRGLSFSKDLSTFYVTGRDNQRIYQYSVNN
jgi:DNA-binding beta-propeller fold protein YncE